MQMDLHLKIHPSSAPIQPTTGFAANRLTILITKCYQAVKVYFCFTHRFTSLAKPSLGESTSIMRLIRPKEVTKAFNSSQAARISHKNHRIADDLL